MSRVLHVFTHGKAVGRLGVDAAQSHYRLDYAAQWIGSRNAFALSPALPLDAAGIASAAVRRYVDNLLPEGRALDVAAALHQGPRHDTFGLLHALGQDPAGAFSFLAPDAGDADAARIAQAQGLEPLRQRLSPDALGERLHARNAVPHPPSVDGRRRSLADDQDQLQVLAEGEQLSLVAGSLSSTHRLKPDSLNPQLPGLVVNEHFCMSLAARMGLPAAPVSIRRIPEPVLLIERFDRSIMWDADTRGQVHAVRRLHVIDGCQALDLSPRHKYECTAGIDGQADETHAGASFARLFAGLDRMVTPATARLQLLRWALLQLLLGNGDAHGKTLSFYVQPAGLVPAPFHDLVSTGVYRKRAATDLAMAYGEAVSLEQVTTLELARFARQTDTPIAQLSRELTRLAGAALKHAPQLAHDETYAAAERELVQAIATLVCVQADRLLALIPALRKAAAALA